VSDRALGKNRKETPKTSTRSSVTTSRGLAPAKGDKREPATIAEVPMAMLHHTISQSKSRERQYSLDATRVLGTVAGRGNATATNPG
jgi:hypothetical protein